MLISPPFLPPTIGPTDNDWVEAAMPGGIPGQGGYPVSYGLGWHGGIHLTAPGADQPVRAIADGTVVYVRQPTVKPDPVPADHPLNYGAGWSSDGCVVIKHVTEIGANEQNLATKVTFYSIDMHLSSLHANARAGQPINRKDEIGMAGEIYGAPDQIHFEIICDDVNLPLLIGEKVKGKTNIATHGRTDAVYGEMYFRLRPSTRIYGGPKPAANVVNPDVAIHPVLHTLCEPLYVGLRYAGGDGAQGNRGDAFLTTYNIDGTPIGAAIPEPAAEYNLYTSATKISATYTTANAQPNAVQTPVPAPSAVYELLRFGRILGPDVPADTPHWRKINFDDDNCGEGWANLNAPEVNKFSDADFPHWRGWTLIDDSEDLDSRCDSEIIKGWLDQDGDGKVDPNEAVSRLPHDAIQAKMKRTICKLPTEWEQATVDHRWSWLKEETEENPAPLTDEDFLKLREHIEALAFWEEANIGISSSHWHFHPREFIKQFRRCGWLSTGEFAQCISRRYLHLQGAQFHNQIVATWAQAFQRAQNWVYVTNVAMRKYAISSSKLRLLHFVAQMAEECGYFRLVKEGNGETAPYAPYYGRGLIQLTHQNNYRVYGNFRAFSSLHPFNQAPFQALGWNPNTLLATNNQQYNAYNCADSAAFYWTCRDITATQTNVLSTSDSGPTLTAVINCSRATNGNVPQQNINGLATRLQAFIFGKYVLLDDVRSGLTEQIQFDWRRNSAKELLFDVNGQPILKPNGQQKQGYVLGTHTINTLLEAQQP